MGQAMHCSYKTELSNMRAWQIMAIIITIIFVIITAGSEERSRKTTKAFFLFL